MKPKKRTPVYHEMTEELEEMFVARMELIHLLGIENYPLIFKNGDPIYYIKDPMKLTFGRGVLLNDTPEYAYVRTDKNQIIKISPFAVLPNPHYL